MNHVKQMDLEMAPSDLIMQLMLQSHLGGTLALRKSSSGLVEDVAHSILADVLASPQGQFGIKTAV